MIVGMPVARARHPLPDGSVVGIVSGMKVISVSVSEDDYEAFRQAARSSNQSVAQLIREAMARFRATQLEARTA